MTIVRKLIITIHELKVFGKVVEKICLMVDYVRYQLFYQKIKQILY